MLTAQALTKRYSGSTALSALDLEVSPGEIFCLLGPNGAGKTTTVNLFLGFTRPTSGRALVGGEPVERDPLAARRRVAYVPEHVQLYPELSGLENLVYFARLGQGPYLGRGELAELLERAGLPRAALDRRASGYSKGMRQKVALALSHAKRASALLLDEPTSGLDPSASADLCRSLERESERGAAVLMVTHDLGAVVSIAHRFGILSGGRLVHVAPAAGLTESALADLYRGALGAAARSAGAAA